MAKFEDYQDEIKDFSLLVNNQLLLSLVMNEVPIVDYKMEVYTPEILELGMASHSITRLKVGDGRVFILSTGIHESTEPSEFRLVAQLRYPKSIIIPEGTVEESDLDKFVNDISSPVQVIEHNMPSLIPLEGVEEKTMHIRPTMNQGEAVVNEIFLWLKEQIAEKISGKN